jgi:hypothetical protein
MKHYVASLLLLLFLSATAATAKEVLIEDWDNDFSEWKARLSRTEENPELMIYETVSGTLEVTVPGTQVTIMRDDIEFPPDTIKLSLEVTPIGKGFKELEVGIAIYSEGKPLDALGRIKIPEGTGKKVVVFPVNILPHIGSSWNKFAIRLYSESKLKVRIDNLKGITRE